MADPQRGYYEVAPPFSVDLPKSEDIRNNDDMEAYLLNSGAIYETEQGEAKRVVVVEKLRLIVQQWALNVAKLKGIPEESLESIGGTGGAQLRIFGSTRLGVHNCDSDIDILCLCASFISRKDFFGELTVSLLYLLTLFHTWHYNVPFILVPLLSTYLLSSSLYPDYSLNRHLLRSLGHPRRRRVTAEVWVMGLYAFMYVDSGLVCMYVCVYVCIYVCMYVHIYVLVYVYTH
jgi:hypothetical protein